jgi:hypothetical protein
VYESPTCDNFWHTIRKSGYGGWIACLPVLQAVFKSCIGYVAMLVIRPKLSYYLYGSFHICVHLLFVWSRLFTSDSFRFHNRAAPFIPANPFYSGHSRVAISIRIS